MVGAADAQPDDIRRAVLQELRSFVGESAGRSVAVQVVDDPAGAPPDRFAVAGEVARPAASVLKLLPAVALYELAGQGTVDLDEVVGVGDLGTTTYPSVLAAFGAGHKLTVREVCALSLITSDNPAAEYLRRLIGPGPVKAVVERLGLGSVLFEAGFTDPELGDLNRRNIASAVDVLELVVHVASDRGLGELRHMLVNSLRNNRIPLRLDDEVQVMNKTGSLEGVANDAGVVYGPQRRVALVFLCDGEADTARTSIEIGDTALRVVELLGGSAAQEVVGP